VTPATWQPPRRTFPAGARPAVASGIASLLRLAGFCALWLALFVWLVPALGTALARQTYTLSTHAVQTLFASASGQHQVWQVGVQADDAYAGATGMRATIQTRLSQTVASGTTSYYWVGAYLRDGSFVQAGYYVPWYDSSHAGWFYCAFTAEQRQGPCVYGAAGTVTAGPHSYTLAATTVAGHSTWQALLDGRALGAFAWSSGDSGGNAPMLYAESSAMRSHPASSTLGPVSFTGFAVLRAGQRAYQPVTTAYPAYSAANVCPPYGLRVTGPGVALLGSGLDCPDTIVSLW
jgi:hypothetical protein